MTKKLLEGIIQLKYVEDWVSIKAETQVDKSEKYSRLNSHSYQQLWTS